MTRDISRWKIRRRSKYEAPHWIFERPIRIRSIARGTGTFPRTWKPRNSRLLAGHLTPNMSGQWTEIPVKQKSGRQPPGRAAPTRDSACARLYYLSTRQTSRVFFNTNQPTRYPTRRAFMTRSPIARLYTRAYPSPTSDRWNRFLLFRYAEDLSFRKVALINESRNLGLLETLLNIEKYNDRLVGFFFISLSF